MFKGKDSSFETVMSERTVHQDTLTSSTQVAGGANIRGDLHTPGGAVVEGRVEGSISAEGDVQIGATGSVEGEVEGHNITIAGSVKGKVFAEEKVILLSGARVEGDIHAKSLKIEDSVFFQGGCIMGEGARQSRADQNITLPPSLKVVKAA
jgi:cytoskeletal protein CcmA (bactofilin family)